MRPVTSAPRQSPVLLVEVSGKPRPQDSAWIGKNGNFRPAAKGLTEWKNDIARAAFVASHNQPDLTFARDDPVSVSIQFYYGRPTTHFRRVKGTPILKDDAPVAKTTVPDVDKLARAVLDGLVQGGVLPDDKQVSSLVAEKSWGHTDRVEIRIRKLNWTTTHAYVTTAA